jgi:hypothetical protein
MIAITREQEERMKEYRANLFQEPRAPGDEMRRLGPTTHLTNVSHPGGHIGESQLPWPY